jgi:hypothetical protein
MLLIMATAAMCLLLAQTALDVIHYGRHFGSVSHDSARMHGGASPSTHAAAAD